MKSDFVKGIIIGIVIGISILFFLGAGSGTVGRYQIEMFNSNLGYIIDTQTGIAKGFTASAGLEYDFNKAPGE